MRTCTWGFFTLLAVLSFSTSQPHSHFTGVTRTRKYLSKAYFCSADSECEPRLYCQAPGHAHSQCSPCKRRARRCRRDQMCCPGNECRNHVCSRISARASAEHTPEQKNRIHSSSGRLKKNRKLNKLRKGELGAQCVRSADCGHGLCCARHLWKRVCKAEPQEGQVCSNPWRRKHTHTGHTLELFQLCPCATGLECRTQSHTPTHTNTHSNTHRPAAAVRLHTCQLL
ncbi:dickkopf-related protein 2-like [Hemibagrus wyckioides]|uniref:dickkopf-related protein 2-like n=1 Tax=Hemibagrus wyckioides TaxID=337641 RepID=UPI00266CB45D|nr:dickkopf-related protein 2-like [Hemibagrus wyckioides]